MTFDIEFGPLKIKNYCQTSVRLILHVNASINQVLQGQTADRNQNR
jgi:hypothetical protein